jgi:hypothetical protein
MATQRLVRAPGHTGAAVRQLDLALLREALVRLLRHDLDQAHLVIQLAVDGAEPATVAAARGVSTYTLVEQLRDAVAALAVRYERLAGGDPNEGPVADVSTRLATGRRPARSTR